MGVWVGLAEIGLGLVFCFFGYAAARVALGLWGAVVGYFAGSMLYVAAYQWFGGGWVATVPEWVFAVVGALLLAWLAFAFYAMGVLFSLGVAGWALGQSIAQATRLPDWMALALAAVLAIGLVVAGLTLNLPRLLLILVTAAAGAGGVIDGIQVLLGSRQPWLDAAHWRLEPTTAFSWAAGYLVLLVAGAWFQSRHQARGTLRDAYRGS